ncbi:uncharacterized protein PV09_03509 [Verruconis gallopava]|uniref:Cytochrome P450 n=1 Tax=Verruconis gallopava TaxID=253628 RepID=A0A0D2AF98_9PEZI|nr:uncharacterized protein PV09_03509 [Verruconis gallopava]KIW05638.1 hypothetical protein PV09_03509 [Verruconis gallopava]
MDAVRAEFTKLTAAFKAQNWDMVVSSKSLPIVLGLSTHLFLAHGEPDYQFHIFIMFWFFVYISFSYLLVASGSMATLSQALSATASFYAIYFGTLFTSIVIYRAFFHRLRKYPGPFMARITNFYNVALTVPKIRYFVEVEKIHKRYGDYVRLGPRDLSIADVNAIPVIHGVGTKCRKGLWYGAGEHVEGFSLHTTRDKKDHRERRRIWDKAFNAKVLREYEPRINRHTAMLIQQLDDRVGKTIHINEWANFYSFDVMGDIGFSKSFGMLEKGEEDQLIKTLHASMVGLGLFRNITWVTSIMLRLPIIQKDLRNFMKWTSDVLKERKKTQPAEQDIFSHLLDPNDEGIPLHLNADARLVIVAGSDTTAATLTWLFYELTKDPAQFKKLQKVVDDAVGDKDLLSCDDVANIPLLDGFINETLRLHPAVPSGVQRETPPEGITIGDKYIPGNIIIWQPIHTIQRDPRYFKEATVFRPERWLEDQQAEWIYDRRAFIPFSTGSYKCIGNNLAMMEMRAVAANIVHKFDVVAAPGEDFTTIENKTMDTFTLTLGKLDVIMTRRTTRRDSGV